MEAASIAAKDAFVKLISNSLLSWLVWHCHSGPWLTTPKFRVVPSPERVLPFCKGLLERRDCRSIELQHQVRLSLGESSVNDAPRSCEKPLFKRLHSLCLAGLLVVSGGAPAQDPRAEQLTALRSVDRQVATIGHRLAVRNVDLCRELQWLPGVAIHDLSQYGDSYREAAIRAFGLDRGPGVLALAAAGPAEKAGLRLDDIIVAADAEPLVQARSDSRRTFHHAERILDAVDRAFADGRARLSVLRGSEALTVSVAAEQGCQSRFQLIPSSQLNARADGRYVQVTTAISEYVQDEQELAAVLAHEFAHNVMRHRARLDEAGVARGFFGNFGRNARLIRETEAEADRLSVYLLDRAGYDPAAAVRFWSRFGRRGLNFLGSPTHPNWRARIALFEAEIARIRAARAAGQVPTPTFFDPDAPVPGRSG
jgi:beta-barrel assembly-enhancing protease